MTTPRTALAAGGLKMARLFNLWPWKRRRAERDLDREIGYHVDRRVEDLQRRGIGEAEARRRAALELGGVAQVKEEVRESWMWRSVDRVGRDFRIAWRSLGKHPGFSATAILTVALGIGSAAVVWSVAEPLLVRPLPVRNPDELVVFRTVSPNIPRNGDFVPEELFHRLDGDSATLSGVIASNIHMGPWSVARTDPRSDPDEVIARVRIEKVTGNYFQLLGLEALRGRVLTTSDDAADAPPAAVISRRLWEQAFGRDPDVVGTTIHLTQLSAYGVRVPDLTVVGVANAEFFGVDLDQRPDIWLPYRAADVFASSSLRATDGVRLMGRTRPGVGLDAVRAETAALVPQLSEFTYAVDDRGAVNVAVEPGHRGYSQLRFVFSRPVLAVGVGVGLVLLIAWVNVAALMLTRGMAREREMAVRLALGSSRPGLLGAFFAEGILLSGSGAVLGLLVGSIGIETVAAYVPAGSGLASEIDLGSSVVSFTGALALIGIVPFVLMPGIKTATTALLSALTARPGISGKRSGSFQAHRITVAAQIALSLTLLVGAALFLRTLDNLRAVEDGFRESNVVEFGIETPTTSTQQWVEFAQSGLPLIQELPGVEVATFYAGEFRSGSLQRPAFSVAVAPERTPVRAESMGLGPAFLETTGIPLVSGRPLAADEPFSSVLLSESLALDLFGGSNPVGEAVFTKSVLASSNDDPAERTVVGVVGDIRPDDGRSVVPMIYFPAGNMPFRIAVRTVGDPSGLVPRIREVVEGFAPGFRLSEVRTLDEAREASIVSERFVADLAAGLGFGALVLVAVGLFGAFSYASARRRPEVGLRIALGAGQRTVVSLMMREVFGVVVAGTAIGVVFVFLTTRLLTGMLYGVPPMDPRSILVAMLVLGGVSLLAAYLPVRRASRVDPMVVLRHD